MYYDRFMTDKKYKGSYRKRKATMDFWLKVATDLNAGLTPREISTRYINPHTDKNYTREHIYYVIREIKTRIA